MTLTTVNSNGIKDDSIKDADIKSDAAISGSKLQAASGSNAGSMSSAHYTKLEGVDSGAKDDQTGAEIKVAYEGESDTNAFTDTEKTKLSGIATGAEVNVQSDWNSGSGDSQILNKPTIPAAQVQSDWNSGSGLGQILNKPTIPANLADLTNVHNTAPSDGEVLKWVDANSRWEPGTDNSGSGSGITDGDYGDIVVSSSGSNWQIDNGVIANGYLVNGCVTAEKISDNNITNQQMADDAIGIAELSATGTPSSSSYLRGDNTWSTVTATDSTKMPLAGGTFTGSVTFEDAINENVYTITDGASVDLDPDNGMIQTWTLGANRTATESLTAGQSMMLMVADGTAYTLTFPTMTWVGGSAPTLTTSGYTVIELWKAGSTLYGAKVGDVA